MKKIFFPFIILAMALFSCTEEEPVFEEIEIPVEEMLKNGYDITINPSGIAPLTARVELRTQLPSIFEYSIKGDTNFKVAESTENDEHSIDILGLFPGITNEVYLKLTNNVGRFSYDTISIPTESYPDYLPEVELISAIPASMEPGWTLTCSALGDGDSFLPFALAIDENGAVRGILNLKENVDGFCAPMEPLQNGNLLFGFSEQLYEYNLMGEEVNSWDLDENYHAHHDVVEKPNGNLVVAIADHDLTTVDDIIIELDRESGDEVNRWDMREILDIDRYDLLEDPVDWFHMNAVWYSESDDCLIISGRNQGVAKVSNENQLVWILAPHQGWGKAGIDGDGFETADYLLTAVDPSGAPYGNAVQMGTEEPDDFSWPWGQHAPMYLPNGNLFLFDNGYNRNFTGAGPYSQGIEYEIDEKIGAVKKVWAYGKERGADFFSSIISDVDYLENTGNRMITSGITFSDPAYSTIIEVGYPDKQVLFEVKLYYKNSFVPEGSTGWGALDLTYRSERIRFNN